ncbi:tetraspanin-4 [Erpetoichthys calabaricus]|uniref:Tetraspanin n=1 Tax=Erpetoichthys calabaricus TaxID=27687 RepID=A0A8C4SAP6_ERPCA|nr:tetraspanin-4 [Erpetoichthys calabaricus]
MSRMAVSLRCMVCVKYLMFLFNLIFWLGGCGLFGVGAWLAITQAPFATLSSSFPSLSAANLFLVLGAVTMVIGFIGCLGAVKEHRCLLMMFFVILLTIFIAEIALGIMLYAFKDKFDQFAMEDLKNGMKHYGKKEEVGLSVAWDQVQTGFKCCGVSNKSDWISDNMTSVPHSCCNRDTDQCQHWEEGCYNKVQEWLMSNITSVLIFVGCISIVQVLALAFSLFMYCQIRKAEKFME